MKWLSQFWLKFFIIYIVFPCVFSELGNPYNILRVKRSASVHEIKKAYKTLVKEWHPDKNSHPDASNKFVEIKQAYELLSDPERRFNYDQKGITEDDYYKRTDHDHNRFQTNPFDELFSYGHHFNFQENDITFFHKFSITTRQYDKVIIARSVHIPHLIFFYTDWCFPCLQIAPVCRKLVEYLEPLGIDFVTVHSGQEASLTKRYNIHSLPSLMLLIDGNVYLYKDSITSVQKIIDFVRKKLPYQLVPNIDDYNIEDFLNGWEDNRVRALIFEPRQNIRLRYLLTAFNFRFRIAFGFVISDDIRQRFQIPTDMDSVLIFNENTSHPVARISMKDIPSNTLNHVIINNQYLALPRLSSQQILESLCPCEWHKLRKRLCVVLITEATSSHDPHRESFRNYAQKAPYSPEKVRFAYIYHEKQIEFVNSLIPDGEQLEPLLNIVIIWRKDTSHVKYEWVKCKWQLEPSLNDTTRELDSTISRILRSTEALSYEAFVKDLFDEHAKGFLGSIITKLLSFSENVYEGMDKTQILPLLSVIGTIIFILVVGYFMAYLVRLEEESIQKQKANAKSGNNNNDSNIANGSYQPELRLHELRSEKYNGLVRLLKPGCRTILLVCDYQSRQQLIPPFHQAVWPYRKNKTLMFSYMLIERGISWYKEILELSLPDNRELNINPRNCVGTVLALNGHRKYFCMFHAKHTEKRRQNYAKKHHTKKTVDCEAAAFIESDSSESEEEILMQGDLLEGLPNWLDRLFEGTTHRYYINYWPDFPNK